MLEDSLTKHNKPGLAIKIGTSTIFDLRAGSLPEVRTDVVREIGRQIQLLRQEYDVFVVSSGAIAMGMRYQGITEKPKTSEMYELQALAGAGNPLLMDMYRTHFAPLKPAQALVTRQSLNIADEKSAAVNAMCGFRELGLLPIINENDTVATDEIRYGDNDQLGAVLARKMGATYVMLSDVNGFRLDKNDPASLVQSMLFDDIEAHLHLAGDAGSSGGTGGMRTKLLAAQIAGAKHSEYLASGENLPPVACYITDGSQSNSIIDALEGRIGTVFKVS